MRSWLVSLAVFALACAPAEHSASDAPATQRAEIIGGSPTGTDDPAVFALYEAQGFFCSATLVHPRVLLTAAHCVAGGVPFVGNAPEGPEDRALTVQQIWQHPRYAATNDPQFDVALVLLSPTVVGVTPRPFDHGELTLEVGTPVRAVGFGFQGPYVMGQAPPPSGERRTVDLSITGFETGVIMIGTQGAAICFGDSGGPLFARNDAGVETVVGVHSFSNDSECSGGGDMQVAPMASLIQEWIDVNTTPTCAADGECVANCAVVDPDCVCVADGQCTAECTRPSLDPDCPRECDADDLCATATCPRPDPDCRAIGATCFHDQQCGRDGICVGDPQHEAAYCSRRCSATNDQCAQVHPDFVCTYGSMCAYRQVPEIPVGLRCTFSDRCAPGSQCHLEGMDYAICAEPCTTMADCPAGYECRAGLATWKACVGNRPPIVIKRMSMSHDAAGCSVGGGSGLGLLALFLQRRRKMKVSATSRTSGLGGPHAQRVRADGVAERLRSDGAR